MRADRKPVRLVAQALQVVENRALLVEPEWGAARNEEALAARVAVDALGDAGDHDPVLQAEFLERQQARVELAFSAINQHEIRPCAELALALVLVTLFGKIDAAVRD